MRTFVCVLCALGLAGGAARGQAPPAGWRVFVDPQGRFEFSYPASFGEPVAGTDSGFRNRVAAVRFLGLAGLGGEAALTSGFIDVDIQAVGGLYDAIARGVLQDADVPTLVIFLTTLLVLATIRKAPEPLLILGAGLVGLALRVAKS
jgi:hypothetical protein